jgi:hypothetical protein
MEKAISKAVEMGAGNLGALMSVKYDLLDRLQKAAGETAEGKPVTTIQVKYESGEPRRSPIEVTGEPYSRVGVVRSKDPEPEPAAKLQFKPSLVKRRDPSETETIVVSHGPLLPKVM